MIARLILVLMLLAGAVPGMAAGAPCHETGVEMAAMPGMPAHRDHGGPAEHRCLGCMPLPERIAARQAPRLARAPVPRPLPVRFAPRAAGPPTTPPPRIG